MFSRERTATFWRMSWRSRQPCSDTVSLSLFFFFVESSSDTAHGGRQPVWPLLGCIRELRGDSGR